MVQYIAMRTNNMIWMAQKCGHCYDMQSDGKRSFAESGKEFLRI